MAARNSGKVPELLPLKNRWLWEDWFQLIVIIALFVLLLFPVWFFLYGLIFRC